MRVGRAPLASSGPAIFGLAATIAGRRIPGYRARDEPISALAAKDSPAAKVMVPGFLALSVGTAGLARELRGAPVAPGPVPLLLSVAAITTAGAGIARCSDRRCPTRWFGDSDATLSDELHACFSMATFTVWILIPLVASRRAAQASQRYRDRCRRLGLAGLVAFVVGGLLSRRPSQRWSGWAQRAMLGLVLSWQIMAGFSPDAPPSGS